MNPYMYFIFLLCLTFGFSHDDACMENLKKVYEKQKAKIKNFGSKHQVEFAIKVEKRKNGKVFQSEERTYIYASNGNVCVKDNKMTTYKLGDKVLLIVPDKKAIIIKRAIKTEGQEFDKEIDINEVFSSLISSEGEISCRDTMINSIMVNKLFILKPRNKTQYQRIIWLSDNKENLVSVETLKKVQGFNISELFTFSKQMEVSDITEEMKGNYKNIVYNSTGKLRSSYSDYNVYDMIHEK